MGAARSSSFAVAFQRGGEKRVILVAWAAGPGEACGDGRAADRENRTCGTVGAASRPTKGERTRERILDLAYESIVEKGFAATSIEELVEAAGITKSGFFYHFRDKNDLARQLFERFLAEDERIIDTLESAGARAQRRPAAELPHLPQHLCRR